MKKRRKRTESEYINTGILAFISPLLQLYKPRNLTSLRSHIIDSFKRIVLLTALKTLSHSR